MNKSKINKILNILSDLYPEVHCALEYDNPLQLLVSSRLSAQCTDARVNLVTPQLFAEYKTFSDYANADVNELETIIKSCGLYHSKARDIIAMGKYLESVGEIPDTMDGLVKIPGVGRKIASLILGEVFGNKNVVVADTHCIRLSNRLGLVDSTNPHIVEKTLLKKLPKDTGLVFSHMLVHHGRTTCKAMSPQCESCALKDICEKHIDKGRKSK